MADVDQGQIDFDNAHYGEALTKAFALAQVPEQTMYDYANERAGSDNHRGGWKPLMNALHEGFDGLDEEGKAKAIKAFKAVDPKIGAALTSYALDGGPWQQRNNNKLGVEDTLSDYVNAHFGHPPKAVAPVDKKKLQELLKDDSGKIDDMLPVSYGIASIAKPGKQTGIG